MQQDATSEIRVKMTQALGLLKEALNISLPLLHTNQKQGVIAIWEGFIREVVTTVKRRSHESGLNLLSFISFKRIWLK